MSSRVVRLAILDAYGVAWTREVFARDLLQNFFDAAPDFRDVHVDVQAEAGVVEIRGPVAFDIDLLAYVGATTKTSGKTAGGFGEGFKICALVGTRDFGLTMSAGAGADELEVFLDPVPLGRELCYRVTRRDGARGGAFVRLEGCDAASIAAFRAAPGMFRHPLNPKLGALIVEDAAQGIAVYASPERGAGELYYRRQLRGRTSFYAYGAEAPVTLAHDGIIDELEGDRDRRDVRGGPIARAIGDKLAPEAIRALLLHLMPYWRHGAEVLSGLLDAAARRKLRFDFPRGWLAKAGRGKGLEAFAERQGIKLALAAFADVGMRTAGEHYGDLATRPADPLERARIQVVAELYAELAGAPARVKEFEVFDDPAAAVLGQHLGSKVIVDAKVLRRGLDGAAGTILHELAHEVGGEEDRLFLRRLQRLIGAAIREPERIRAARRRFAEARPDPAAAPGPKPAAYTPERDHRAHDARGVVCTLVVPPAFPPTEEIAAALRDAAREADVGLWIVAVVVTGPIGAASWRAPGLPTLWIGDADPEPGEPGATPGYRLRTYGPEARLVPDRDALRAALRRAADLGLKGIRGIEAHHAMHAAGKREAEALLGVRFPEQPATKPPSARERRDNAVLERLEAYSGGGSFHLDGFWGAGILKGGMALLRRRARDRRGADEVWADIKATLERAIACSRELRRADADFDDADALERDAMGAAQGAAVAAFAEERDEAAARARAADRFHAVRAAAARVLDLDVVLGAKPAILEHALRAAGLDRGQPGAFDPARFGAALDRAIGIAQAMQARADEEGLPLHGGSVGGALFQVELARKRRRGRLRPAALAAAEEARVAVTLAIRRAYDEALAATGSQVVAAARCLEEAARLQPEAAP